jgi:hypothetical protein
MSLNLTKPTAKQEVDFMRDEAFEDKKSLAIAVEGKDDEAFWSFVFDRSELKGQYRIYKSYQYPTPNSSGKETLKHFSPHTQSDFAICMDSDYDYLLDNPVWQRPFVFQTYTYSTENYYCYVPSLKKVVNRAANLPLDTEGGSFEHIFIEHFSSIIYDLMIQSVQDAVNEGRSDEARRKLGKNIRLKGQTIDIMLTDLNTRTQNIRNRTFTNEFRNQLSEKGLTPETTYLFARGHDIFNSVFLPILKLIREEKRNKKLLELAAISDTSLRKSSEKTYRMGVIDIKTCLLENRDFTDCFLFQKIEEDIRAAF